jgi:hypothetical protein
MTRFGKCSPYVVIDDRHRHCGGHSCATGVAYWVATSERTRPSDNETQQLAAHFDAITVMPASAQHRDVHVDVIQRPRLRQNVGAFEM